MDATDVSDMVTAMREDFLGRLIDTCIPPESLEELWDVPGLETALEENFGGEWPVARWLDQDHALHEETLRTRIAEHVAERYVDKEKVVGADVMRQLEKAVMLQTLDTHWKDHLAAMDYLRQGIHLRGYAQRDPKQEYKREAFQMFTAMLDSIKQEVVMTLSKLQIQTSPDMGQVGPYVPHEQEFEFKHEEFQGFGAMPEEELAEESVAPQQQPFVRDHRKVGRNEPCPCGSGKKYKHCCGRAA